MVIMLKNITLMLLAGIIFFGQTASAMDNKPKDLEEIRNLFSSRQYTFGQAVKQQEKLVTPLEAKDMAKLASGYGFLGYRPFLTPYIVQTLATDFNFYDCSIIKYGIFSDSILRAHMGYRGRIESGKTVCQDRFTEGDIIALRTR